MAGLLSLLCFALALGGLAFAGGGLRVLLAARRLNERLAGRALPAARAEDVPSLLRLPSFFVARGRDREEIEAKLRLAGFEGAQIVDRFVLLRLGATAAGAGAMMIASRLFWGGFLARPLAVLIGAGLMFIAAKQALQLMANHRARALTSEFPFLIDLMLMMLESGVSLDQCFRSIIKDESAAAPRHVKLIAMLVDDLDRGMSYEVALDRWAARVGIAGARELAVLFRQGLFQGVQLTPALREFADEFTQRRIARAREAAGQIAVRMVVLMLLFFMPALFIVLGGPPVVTLFDTLKGMRQ